jgi:alkylation response protein AidB-like acyl-CoA dehydrogenase
MALAPLLAELGEDELLAEVATGEAIVTVAAAGEYIPDADIAVRIYRVHGGEIVALANPHIEPVKSVDGARRLFRVEGEIQSVAGDGAAVARRATVAASAQLVGIAEHLLDTAVAYAKERRQFSKPIGSFQAIQHHLADALLKIRFAKPVVYRAAWSMATDHPDVDVHVSMAKCFAADAADISCRKSLQVHGAIGYTFEYDLHLWMKRAWALRNAWGSPQAHRDRVADAIF